MNNRSPAESEKAAASNSFPLELDRRLWAELTRLARRYGRQNASEVAVEIITQHLDLWREVQARRQRLLRQQRQRQRAKTNRS